MRVPHLIQGLILACLLLACVSNAPDAIQPTERSPSVPEPVMPSPALSGELDGRAWEVHGALRTSGSVCSLLREPATGSSRGGGCVYLVGQDLAAPIASGNLPRFIGYTTSPPPWIDPVIEGTSRFYDGPEYMVYGAVSSRVDSLVLVQRGRDEVELPLKPYPDVPDARFFGSVIPKLNGRLIAYSAAGRVLESIRFGSAPSIGPATRRA